MAGRVVVCKGVKACRAVRHASNRIVRRDMIVMVVSCFGKCDSSTVVPIECCVAIESVYTCFSWKLSKQESLEVRGCLLLDGFGRRKDVDVR